MAFVFYPNNDNTFRISPVRPETGAPIETSVIFSVTLKDPDGNPVSGATALLTAYRPIQKDNAVVIPGTIAVAVGTGYLIQAAALGGFAQKITFEDVPVIVDKRTN